MDTEVQFGKVFNKWDPADVMIKDIGIERHISLMPVSALHSGGAHASQQFEESKVCIVERLINKIMRSEHNTGKKLMAYRIVNTAFDLVHAATGQNPLQVLVDAIQNAGPREETIRLRFGGILVPKAVDMSSQRRVDQALMFITLGAEKCAFKNKKRIEQCLADELIAASRNAKCFSVNKKEEKERIARAAR
ncbi:MAG: 30S ribosomal protein S7 [Methanomicrobia archaeon]|nr:30S ribosomal protein S7 [Methanomicrobia archaeon]